ncbi:MAG: Hint domain-containing protein, partial [Pseudomonadota bacterium]
MTADHGPQRIRWKGLRHITGTALAANPKQRPIKIEKGALGRGPVRDLFVSRQHRMLLQGPAVARHFGADAVFAPAIHLVGLPGVSEVQPAAGVTYLHILCDQHEVLFAEGAATESLYLGPTLLGDASSAEAAALWSELQRVWQGGTLARPIARPQAIRRFVARTRRAEPALA